MTVYIQKVNTSANTALGLFGKERFVYEPQEDCYRCDWLDDLGSGTWLKRAPSTSALAARQD